MATGPSSSADAELLVSKTKDDFLLLSELGEGSYSTVFLASERQTSRKFAVKICLKKKILKEKKVQQVFRERDILRLLSTPDHSSPLIVRLYCTFQDPDSLYFVLTLAERKDLLSRIKALKRFTLQQCHFVMAELWTALAHIHSLNVVHRDVKPENVLLRRDGHILLSDFGCAKCLVSSAGNVPTPAENDEKNGEEMEEENGKAKGLKRWCSFVGTAQYVSPEVLNGVEVTTACDWWAFGVILFELLAGKRPFSGDSEYLLFRQILRLAFQFPDDFPSASAASLVRTLLVLSPRDRLGADAIQDHPFFEGTEWGKLESQKSPLFPEDELVDGKKNDSCPRYRN